MICNEVLLNEKVVPIVTILSVILIAGYFVRFIYKTTANEKVLLKIKKDVLSSGENSILPLVMIN